MGLRNIFGRSDPDFSVAPGFQSIDNEPAQPDALPPRPHQAHVSPFTQTVYFPKPLYASRNDQDYVDNYGTTGVKSDEDIKVSLSIPRVQYSPAGGLAPGSQYLTILIVIDYDRLDVSDLYIEADWRPFIPMTGGLEAESGPLHTDARFRVGKHSQTNLASVNNYWELLHFPTRHGARVTQYESAARDLAAPSIPIYSAIRMKSTTWASKAFSSKVRRPVVIEATVVCSEPCTLSMRVGMMPGRYDTGKFLSPTETADVVFWKKIFLSEPSRPIFFNGRDNADFTKSGVDVRYDMWSK